MCRAVPSGSRKASPCLSYRGCTAPKSSVSLLWRKPAGLMGTSVRVAKATSMGLSMARGSSAISAVPAAIRTLSQPALSCRLGHQAAADNLVPGLLSHWPGRSRRLPRSDKPGSPRWSSAATWASTTTQPGYCTTRSCA